jgi:hypothetical protein
MTSHSYLMHPYDFMSTYMDEIEDCFLSKWNIQIKPCIQGKSDGGECLSG